MYLSLSIVTECGLKYDAFMPIEGNFERDSKTYFFFLFSSNFEQYHQKLFISDRKDF
jgi:hypothetical protein